MKKTKEMKSNKAITLISLVITIIVLLILVGVTINTLTGEHGLINRAITTKEKAEVAGIEETLQLAIETVKIDWYKEGAYGTVGEYLTSHISDLQTAVGDNTLTVNGNKITYSGREFTINSQTGKITGSTIATPSKSWSTAIEGGKTVITDGEGNKIKIGDKIDYDPSLEATKTTETSYATDTGYDNDQVFSVSSLAKTSGENWRVFGFNEATKEIIIIPENFVGPITGGEDTGFGYTYYLLKGQKGYINGESELTKICDLYGHGKYATGARCITDKDINDITGYDKTTYSRYGVEWTYGRNLSGDLTYSDGGSNSGTNNYDIPNFYYPYEDPTTHVKSWKNLDSSKTGEIVSLTRTKYNYTISVADNIKKELLLGKQNRGDSYFTGSNGAGADFRYWLGSSYVIPYSGEAYFGLRVVASGYMSGCDLARSTGFEEPNCFGVRPLVSLQSNVNLKYNSTSTEWEFK